MASKNILFVTDTLNGYGAEKILQWIGLSLSKRGYGVTFCEIFINDKGISLPSNVNYYNVGLERSSGNIKYLVEAHKGIKGIIKKNGCDYAVSFLKNSFYNLLLLKVKYHFNLVISERNDPYSLNSFFERIKKYCVRYADIIVFQTEGAKSFYDIKTQRKSLVIENPIEIPNVEWKRDRSLKQIVNVGRLHVSKRQDLLIRAFARLLKVYPNYQLVILGDGPYKEKLNILTKELGVEKKVVFLGKVDDVNDWMLQSSMFVLSSSSEGIPNVLLEAMALGMPVVSTDCSPGGARLLIKNGVNGLLVENGNRNELTTAMEYMIENEARANEMAKQARLDMEKYKPEIIIDKWAQIFK